MSELTRIPFTDFNSTVYENPNISATGIHQQRSSSNNLPTEPFKVSSLTLISITFIIIIVIPAACCCHLLFIPQRYDIMDIKNIGYETTKMTSFKSMTIFIISVG